MNLTLKTLKGANKNYFSKVGFFGDLSHEIVLINNVPALLTIHKRVMITTFFDYSIQEIHRDFTIGKSFQPENLSFETRREATEAAEKFINSYSK